MFYNYSNFNMLKIAVFLAIGIGIWFGVLNQMPRLTQTAYQHPRNSSGRCANAARNQNVTPAIESSRRRNSQISNCCKCNSRILPHEQSRELTSCGHRVHDTEACNLALGSLCPGCVNDADW